MENEFLPLPLLAVRYERFDFRVAEDSIWNNISRLVCRTDKTFAVSRLTCNQQQRNIFFFSFNASIFTSIERVDIFLFFAFFFARQNKNSYKTEKSTRKKKR